MARPSAGAPSVTNTGPQSGAHTTTTCGTIRRARAKGRAPTSSVRKSLVTGSIATHPQGGDRDTRSLAWAFVISPSLTALRMAYHAASCPCFPCTSQSKEAVQAWRCSAASTNQARTVLGAISKTRGRPDTHACGQAGHHVHDALHGHWLASARP